MVPATIPTLSGYGIVDFGLILEFHGRKFSACYVVDYLTDSIDRIENDTGYNAFSEQFCLVGLTNFCAIVDVVDFCHQFVSGISFATYSAPSTTS